MTSGTLGHLCHPGAGAAFHFCRGHVFDMLREIPLVAEWIANLAVTVTPELVLQSHFHLGAGLNGALK